MTNIGLLPIVTPSEDQQRQYQEHADATKRTVSVTGKTLSLLLQIAPEGVPENRRGDLIRLQDKATRIHLDIMADTLEHFHPGGMMLPADVSPEQAQELSESMPRDDDEAMPENDLPTLSEEDKQSPVLTDAGDNGLPDIEFPDFDGPKEQAIASLGNQYHWKLEDGGRGKIWQLDSVEATKEGEPNEDNP